MVGPTVIPAANDTSSMLLKDDIIKILIKFIPPMNDQCSQKVVELDQEIRTPSQHKSQ